MEIQYWISLSNCLNFHGIALLMHIMFNPPPASIHVPKLLFFFSSPSSSSSAPKTRRGRKWRWKKELWRFIVLEEDFWRSQKRVESVAKVKSVTASNQRAACISPICYTRNETVGKARRRGENLIDFLKLHKQTLWIGKKRASKKNESEGATEKKSYLT